MAGFVHRPQGTDALPTAGSVARLELAVRAVLRTDDGGVLVTSITRRPDGSFTGEVYGVTPRERHVAVGDRITFAESQVFTYKTAEAKEANREDVERAEMIRAFGESFRDAAPANAERAAAEARAPADFGLDADSTPAPPPPPKQPPPAAPSAEIPRARPAAPPAAPPPPPPPEPELSVDDAYAILRGAEPEPNEPRETRVEPAMHVQPALMEDEAPAAAPVATEPIACMECGATLVVPGAEGQPPPLKVSCGSCGRINDVAQAAAATRSRRVFAPRSDV
jgi:hypothetical protein